MSVENRAWFAQKQTLYVLWSVSVACPARYSDLFEPIEGMHVIYSLEELRPVLEHPQRDLQQQQLPPETCTVHPRVRDTPAETHMYGGLVPLASLRRSISEGVEACGGSRNFVAMHVRRSDHAVDKKKQTSDDDFKKFLDDLEGGACGGAELGVFLATDNPATQKRYSTLCGESPGAGGGRLRHLLPMEHDVIPDDPAFRFTSVERAVCDIFICVEALVFKGSHFSSFSDAIQRLRLQRGYATVADEHALLPSKTDPAGRSMLRELASVVLEARRDEDGASNRMHELS